MNRNKAVIFSIAALLLILGSLLSAPGIADATSYPSANWIAADVSNYTLSDRENTYDITYIVIHVSEGSYQSAINTFQNPSSDASAHYVISRTGDITSMVRDEDIAWQAGNGEYNLHSIGIEHEGYVSDPDSLTEAQYQASANLVAWLAQRYNIELVHPSGIAPASATSSGGIIGHNQVPDPDNPSMGGGINHHTDPGPYWDWEHYMNLLTGSNFYFELAENWAPVWYQDTDSTDYDADYITNFNFDGNWNGTDNWENQPGYSLNAYIYYWVVETETHWFIGYADFHPRDWKATGHHENDMEGCLLVVNKDGSTYGQIILMITIAHIDFYSYKNPSSSVTGGNEDFDGDITFNGSQPCVYVEAQGHGVYGEKSDAYPYELGVSWEEEELFPGGDGITYIYTGTAEEPEESDNWGEPVGYDLRDISEIWNLRYPLEHPDTFDEFGAFAGDDGSKANAPWGLDDWNDGEVFQPDLFMDPAYLVDYYHDGLGTFSHSYTYRSYGGVVETFHPYRSDYQRNWAWHVPGAEAIRVHFEKVITEANGDYISFYDKYDSQVGDSISDVHVDYWSPWVEGDTIKIGFDTDLDISFFWGFYADRVEYQDIPVFTNGIIVEDANMVWTSTFEHSAGLDSAAQDVAPRIVVEYSDSISEFALQGSDELDLVADVVTARIVVEYADSIAEFTLQGSAELDQLAGAVMPRIVVEYADSIAEFSLEGSIELDQLAGDITPMIIVEYADSLFSTILERPPFLPDGISVVGITREVNCNILPDVEIMLDGIGPVVSDGPGNYTIMAPAPGDYTVYASKAGFREESGVIHVELPGPVTFNFQGEYGLIPNAPDIWYALDCVNLWLYPPAPPPECGLDIWTALEVVNAWLYPIVE